MRYGGAAGRDLAMVMGIQGLDHLAPDSAKGGVLVHSDSKKLPMQYLSFEEYQDAGELVISM